MAKNSNNLQADLKKSLKLLQNLQSKELPEKIGELLIQSIDEAFEKEKYQSDKWKPRKNDKESGKERNLRRGLLVGSGEMRHAFEAETTNGEVRITNDKIYTPVHNEGLHAGRGAGFEMPKRQMAPIEGEAPPKEVQDQIDDFIDDQIIKILG